MTKKKYILIIGIVLIIGIFFFALSRSNISGYPILNDFEGNIAVYKSASCGCCTIYGNYFKKKGNSNTEIITMRDVDSIKIEQGVPSNLKSCHTTIVGDYFIEGHIPLEAVNKLLEEEPDIAGIAMPGMPAGSPGMPGPKNGDFVIYSVNYDGSYEEFMRI